MIDAQTAIPAPLEAQTGAENMARTRLHGYIAPNTTANLEFITSCRQRGEDVNLVITVEREARDLEFDYYRDMKTSGFDDHLASPKDEVKERYGEAVAATLESHGKAFDEFEEAKRQAIAARKSSSIFVQLLGDFKLGTPLAKDTQQEIQSAQTVIKLRKQLLEQLLAHFKGQHEIFGQSRETLNKILSHFLHYRSESGEECFVKPVHSGDSRPFQYLVLHDVPNFVDPALGNVDLQIRYGVQEKERMLAAEQIPVLEVSIGTTGSGTNASDKTVYIDTRYDMVLSNVDSTGNPKDAGIQPDSFRRLQHLDSAWHYKRPVRIRPEDVDILKKVSETLEKNGPKIEIKTVDVNPRLVNIVDERTKYGREQYFTQYG